MSELYNDTRQVERIKAAQKATQLPTVVGREDGTAKIDYWERAAKGWSKECSTDGFVGKRGVTQNKVEGDQKTPIGVFSFDFAFGMENPGTAMPFKQITKNAYWISNSDDSQYNTWQERAQSDKRDEHLMTYRDQYKYTAVIDYNTDAPVQGKGSAIFLHVATGAPTDGCVSISEERMGWLLTRLRQDALIIIASSEDELLTF